MKKEARFEPCHMPPNPQFPPLDPQNQQASLPEQFWTAAKRISHERRWQTECRFILFITHKWGLGIGLQKSSNLKKTSKNDCLYKIFPSWFSIIILIYFKTSL